MQLLRLVDVTQDIRPLVPRVARRIQRQLKLLEKRTCPQQRWDDAAA